MTHLTLDDRNTLGNCLFCIIFDCLVFLSQSFVLSWSEMKYSPMVLSLWLVENPNDWIYGQHICVSGYGCSMCLFWTYLTGFNDLEQRYTNDIRWFHIDYNSNTHIKKEKWVSAGRGVILKAAKRDT